MVDVFRPLRVAYAGTPEFAVRSLYHLIQSRHDVRLVFTQPDRPAGRGQRLQPSPVKAFAQDNNVPVYQPIKLGPEAAAMMMADNIDVLVVAAYGQIVSQEILDAPRFGCINNHASLLPRWRGAAPIVHAILSGDKETGVTIMQMDSGMDTGAILYQKSEPIVPGMTQSDLLQRLATVGAESLIEVLDHLSSYQAGARQQPSEGVTYAAKITKEHARIDWTVSAEAVVRHVCAYHGTPMAFTDFNSERVRIVEARVLPLSEPHGLPSGSVISVSPAAVCVACGEGGVELTRIQLPGDVARAVSSHHDRFASLFTGGRFSARAG